MLIIVVLWKICTPQIQSNRAKLTEHAKEKNIAHTVTTETQRHPVIPVSPSDTSTGKLQQHALKSHNHSIKKQKKKKSSERYRRQWSIARQNKNTCTKCFSFTY